MTDEGRLPADLRGPSPYQPRFARQLPPGEALEWSHGQGWKTSRPAPGGCAAVDCLPQMPQQRLAKRKARKQEQTKSNFAPRLPTPRSVRLLGILTSNVRRRDDGAIDARGLIRTTPVLPKPAGQGWAQSAFSFGPCTARFLFGKTKRKWGVQSPGNLPASPPSHGEGIHP